MTSDPTNEGMLAFYWMCGGLAAVCLAVSYISLRFLRRLPDFPDKPAMLRGAKWGGLVFSAWLAVMVGLSDLCLRTDYSRSGSLLVQALWLAGLFWFLLRFRVEGDGTLAAFTRLRVRPFDFDRWLADRNRVTANNRKWLWLTCVVAAVNVGCMGWMAVRRIGQDRHMAAVALDTAFGAQLQRLMGMPEVQSIETTGPAAFQGSVYSLDIQVRFGMTTVLAESVAKRARDALDVQGDRLFWRIRVVPERGRPLAVDYYVPAGMTLPAGADQIRPRPRAQ